MIHKIRNNGSMYSGLKGQYTLAQPSGLGFQGIPASFALKGQHKISLATEQDEVTK